MSEEIRLGKNIRCLRKAYGETQEQLGEVIGVEKNTISYYENGKREPDKETLTAIASHFMISVEELMFCDLSENDKINFDYKIFWENIDSILPIAVSEKAMENEFFRNAYTIHKKIFDELQKQKLESIGMVIMCIEGYAKAYEDEISKVEAAVNFLGLWYFFTLIIKNTPEVLISRTAAMEQIMRRDSKIRNTLENSNQKFHKEAKKIAEIMFTPDTEKMVKQFLTVVKKSSIWCELGDYYLALLFVWNIVDNGLKIALNRRIGAEMLNAFLTVGNPYATNYLDCLV